MPHADSQYRVFLPRTLPPSLLRSCGGTGRIPWLRPAPSEALVLGFLWFPQIGTSFPSTENTSVMGISRALEILKARSTEGFV